MPTYDVKETTSGNLDSEMDDQGFLQASVSRSFTILLDDGTSENVITVKRGASNLPREGSRHPSNVNFVCKSVSVEKTSVCLYEATANYESPVFKQQEGGNEDENPLNVPADIQFSTVVSEEETQSDINGDALTNSAGSPFTGITMEITDMAISIAKNVATFNPTQMQYYNGAINSDSFLGYEAGQLKLQNYTATPVIGEINYWKLTISLLARTPTPQVPADKVWYRRVQDKGRYILEGDEQVPAYLGENVKIASNVEVNLDSSGGRLPDGAPPQFKFFQMNLEASFNALGIL
jgi:hypothetical protein